MWVFTKDGFYSVVEHRDEPERVLIRARSKDDIVRICKVVDTDTAKYTPKADYPYRMTVTKKQWSLYLQKAVMDIDYPNFKSAMEKISSKDRMDQLHEVWAIMAGV